MMQILKKVNLKKAKNNFKTETIRFGFFIFVIIAVSSCRQEQQLSAQYIVEQSVDAHGGIVNWKSITALSFDKTTILYRKDGAVESSITQQQSFKFKPELSGRIVSFYKGIVGLYYNGKTFRKKTGDSIYTVIDSMELEAVKNSFFAAHFVVSQPFKLMEQGTTFRFGGIETLDDKQVYVIDVDYDGDAKSSDKWTYYFDVDSYQLMANKVIHNTNVSLIKNLKFDSSTGILFNAQRKSYTLNSLGDLDFLRAEYFYENFKISQ